MARVVPPDEAAAQFRFGLLRPEDLPDLAASWLAVDLDTPALRQLAGESALERVSIRELWAQTCEELGLPAATDDEVTRLRAVRDLLLRWQAGGFDRLAVLDAMQESDVWDIEHAGLVGSSSAFQEVVVLFWDVYEAGRWRSAPATDADIDDALGRLLAKTTRIPNG
jgi:hypothetical protein